MKKKKSEKKPEPRPKSWKCVCGSQAYATTHVHGRCSFSCYMRNGSDPEHQIE